MITPQNAQHHTELSILGYLMARNNRPYAASDVFSLCPAKAFLHSDTRPIAEAMADLAGNRQDTDPVGVANALKSAGKLASVGGAGIVAEIAMQFGSEIWTEARLFEAARDLASEHKKREAQTGISGIMRSIQTPGVPADQIAEDLRKAATDLDADADHSAVSFADQVDEYVAALDSPERLARPVKTPWISLTRILRGGILPGELAVLAARPSVGKSAFALNFAFSVACSGKKSQFHSLEMSRQQLIDRLVANVGNVDVGAFREGVNATERQKAKDAALKVRGVPLQVFDCATAKVRTGDIRHRIRAAQHRGSDIGLVVVDYLQLMEPQERLSNREREVAEMSRALKQMAGELNVPILLLAQLNRKSEEAKREPLLSDLRESGAIEQDADIVIFLHQARSAYGNPNEPVRVIVAKGRSSGVGKVHLEFQRRFQRFVDSDEAAYVGAMKQEEEELRRHWTDQQGDLA